MCDVRRIGPITRTFFGVRCNGCGEVVDYPEPINVSFESHERPEDYSLRYDFDFVVHTWSNPNRCPNCNESGWWIIEICPDAKVNGWPEDKPESRNVSIR